MQENPLEPPGPAPRRWWPTIALLALIALIVVILLAFARSSPTLRSQRDVIAAPAGAPEADAYVLVENQEIDADDLQRIVLDLGDGPLIRRDSVRYLAHATSTLGDTHLLDWLQDDTSPDGTTRLLSCQGQLSNYGSSGSGGAGCDDATSEPTGPLVSRGATVGDDESFGRVAVFETPVRAHWLAVTTQADDVIVGNVVNATSYVEWVSSERGTVKKIALLNEGFVEVWVYDGP